MNNNGWGGTREGSGRKRMFKSYKNVNVTMTEEMYAFVQSQGNMANYIRELIQREIKGQPIG